MNVSYSGKHPITDGCAFVHKHDAGASVLRWDDTRQRITDMDVLRDFWAETDGRDGGLFGSMVRWVRSGSVDDAAERWAADYNAGGGRRERALRSIGR